MQIIQLHAEKLNKFKRNAHAGDLAALLQLNVLAEYNLDVNAAVNFVYDGEYVYS